MATQSLQIPSPHIRVLVTFLAKDKIQVAANMVRTWIRESTGVESRPQQLLASIPTASIPAGLCSDCYISHSMKLNSNALQCGYEFHWSCILKQLSLMRIVVDEKENKLNNLPLFLTLPVVTQRNFILLIKEFLPSIPTDSLMNFISTIRTNINHDPSSSWLQYLLTSLHCTNDSKGEVTRVPFTTSLIHRVTHTFGLTDSDSNVISHYDDGAGSSGDGLEGTDPCITIIDDSPVQHPSRKRPLDNDEEGFNKSKRLKIDLNDQDDELNDDELGTIQLGTPEHENVISSTQECIDEQSVDRDASMMVSKGSEILKQWKDGVLCSQSDFDEIISSNQLLTVFIQEAIVHTYSDVGIQSMINNLLNSKTVITHINLLNYFKQLLVEKIVELQIKNIPRSLISLISSLFEKHPFSFVEGFLLSLLCHDRFASNHCAVACKMIKDLLTNDHCTRLWTNIMRVTANSEHKWSDQLMSCLTVLIDKSGTAFHIEHNDFICSLEINATHHCKSMQFAKFLLALITKCDESKLLEVKDIFVKIVSDNKSPLKRNLLKRLEDKHMT